MKFSASAVLSLLSLIPALAQEILPVNVTDETQEAVPISELVNATEAPVDVVVGETLDVVAGAQEDLTTLVAALTPANLIPALQNTSRSLTVFAPTDEALVNFPTKLLEPSWIVHLTNVLLYHVTEGTVLSTDLVDGMTFSTLLVAAGGSISVSLADGVSFSGPAFNSSNVVEADVTAANGVIHKVDALFLPEFMTVDLWALASDFPAFSTIAQLIVQVGLESVLQQDGITVFAPDNSAFENLPQELFAQIDMIEAVLSKHVASGVFPRSMLTDGLRLTTVNDETLVVAVEGMGQFATVTVDGVSIQVFDETASNGLVHILTDVLYELPDVPAPTETPPTGTPPTATPPTSAAPAQSYGWLAVLLLFLTLA